MALALAFFPALGRSSSVHAAGQTVIIEDDSSDGRYHNYGCSFSYNPHVPGDTIWLGLAEGFTGNDVISILLDGTTFIGFVNTDIGGSAMIDEQNALGFYVPGGTQPGAHTISLVDTQGVTFSCAPGSLQVAQSSITLNTAFARVGSTVRLTGTGFYPGDTATIQVEGTLNGQPFATNVGSVRVCGSLSCYFQTGETMFSGFKCTVVPACLFGHTVLAPADDLSIQMAFTVPNFISDNGGVANVVATDSKGDTAIANLVISEPISVSVTLNPSAGSAVISPTNYFAVSYKSAGATTSAPETGGTLTFQADSNALVTISGKSSASNSNTEEWCLQRDCKDVSFFVGTSPVSQAFVYYDALGQSVARQIIGIPPGNPTIALSYTGMPATAGPTDSPQTASATLTSFPFTFEPLRGSSASVPSVVPGIPGERWINLGANSWTISGTNEITGLMAYHHQWRLDLMQGGLDSSAQGAIVTLNGNPIDFGSLPYSQYLDSGSVASNAWTNFVPSSSLGIRFDFEGAVGGPPLFTISGPLTVIGNFVPQVVAVPSLATAPSPTSVTLGTSSITLRDSATLSGGSSPSGAITFTLLFGGCGGTIVDTETVTVAGDGSYTTPTGYTLPTSGTVTGTYEWTAQYGGDSQNGGVETSCGAEEVIVSPAITAIRTTPIPSGLALGTGSVTLQDIASLFGGYSPSGTLTFTLVSPGGATVDTETVSVSGNGVYVTPTGYTLPTSSPVTGTYQWNAVFTPDNGNNNPASDVNDGAEQATVIPATPTIITTPSTSSVTLEGNPFVLKDSSVLSGGYSPTGLITFNLAAPGGATVDTETVPVNSNGVYTTPTGFPLSSGSTTGMYQWNAVFTGDGNNNPALDINSPQEQVGVVSSSAATGVPEFPVASMTFLFMIALLLPAMLFLSRKLRAQQFSS